eukprot:TRINITY_DN38551_c0_g1_i1.p1 TRINITY_DN38551_c0_g1~~TRINITY_DN38551_c0_g1_i1.p1  ORF type:complete len:755 (+),score=138.08 TRINITY_DN38551_c0_g1_i1:37-2265(+)
MATSSVNMIHVIKALQVLQTECWAKADDPMANRMLVMLSPLSELLNRAVVSIFQEMKGNPCNSQVQGLGIHLVRAVVQDNATCKQIVFCSGGAEALMQSLQHLTDELLLSEALEAIDEIHGLSSLLNALGHLKESAIGAKALLRAFASAARRRWSDVQQLPPANLIGTLLGAVFTHPGDEWILVSTLKLLADLLLEGPEWRSPFASAGGWEWLLGLLESHASHGNIQLHGFKALSSLGCGGSCGERHIARCIAVLERAMCEHEDDACVMYWALWAAQRLNGARALVVPLCSGSFKTPKAAVAALQCLGGILFGQSDGASVMDMPAVIDAVVQTMEKFPEHDAIHYEGTIVLGHAGAFVVGGPHASSAFHCDNTDVLITGVRIALQALVQLIRVRLADAETVKAACQAIAEIAEACQPDSLVRTTIVQSLLGKEDGQTEPLLSIVTSTHLSHHALQTTAMWINGIMFGAAPVVHKMREHLGSHEVQLSGVRTLGLLYHDWVDLNERDAETLVLACSAVIAAMAKFPQDLVIQQHACWALYAVYERDVRVGKLLGQDISRQSVGAAAEALRLVHSKRENHSSSDSYSALHVRKEATRCITAVCRTDPSLGLWLRERQLHSIMTETLQSTAEGARDGGGKRTREVEEMLCLELLALSYILGPGTVLAETLRRWGASKLAVVCAVADAVVEIARRESSLAASVAPLQALREAGCSAELRAAMKAHSADEDLQSRVELAVGFLECQT